MNAAIAAAAVAASFLLASVTLNLEKVHRIKVLCPHDMENQEDGKQLTQAEIRILSVIVAIGAAGAMWRTTVSVSSVLNVTKLAVALVLLTGSACVDYIEHRIPNFFSGTLALLAVTLLTAAFSTEPETALEYVISSVFAVVVSVACLTLGSILSHQGIGFGDIKLIGALALMGGVYIVGGTLLFSMLLCAVASVFLLITKKKTMKEAIPFGPFILVGYMMTLCLIKY